MVALVTGADQRQGLGVIRALGERGIPVVASASTARSMGFFSRYVAHRFVYPSPISEKVAFVQALKAAVDKYNVAVIFPTGDSAAIALDEFREELEPLVKLALTPRGPLHLALNKRRTLEIARSLDCPVPRTVVPRSIEEALECAEAIGYPVVLKPSGPKSFRQVPDQFEFKVTYAKNREDLEETLHGLSQDDVFPMLQEYVSGIGVCHPFLILSGRLIGIYQYERVREYPLTGGTSSVHMGTEIDPDLEQRSLSVLRAMDYEGIGMVEYRRNSKTGHAVLMEVNGRIWGVVSATNKLGLNFPYAYYRYLIEGITEELPRQYLTGRRFRHLRGDLQGLIEHLREETKQYLDPLPSKGQAVTNFLKDFRPTVQSEVSLWSDPLPGLYDFGTLVSEVGGSAVKSAWRKIRCRGCCWRRGRLRKVPSTISSRGPTQGSGHT